MANNKQKVFHLEIEGEHHYFGSPKAMFDLIGEARLHMKYASFHSNISLKVGDVYVNRRNGWIVRVGELGQAKTNRGNRWHDIIEGGIASALAARGISEVEPVQTEPIANEVAEKAEQPIVETAAEQPVVETIVESVSEPVAEPAPVAAPEPAEQTPAEEPVRRPAPRSKKKNNDIPEQLTLF